MSSIKFEIMDFDNVILTRPKKKSKQFKETAKTIRATLKHNIIVLPIKAKKAIRREAIIYAVKMYPELKSEMETAIIFGKLPKNMNSDTEKKIDKILDFYSDISKIISLDLSALRIQKLKK
jgi:hypothetical protein